MNKSINCKFKIKVVGIGDFGISIVESLAQKNTPNVEYLDMNTDWAFMYECKNAYLKIGKKITKGIGTAAHPEFGRKAAEEQREEITNALKDSNLVIIVAGIGGGTGSGASPVIAEIAKELNIPTIAFVTTPPQFEGKIRQKNSEDNIYKLQNSVDMLFEVSVQNYVKNCHLSKTPILKIFKEIGEILQESISNIVDLINTQTSKKESIHNIFKLIQSNENGKINKSAVKIVNNK